jgi:hypothetical protein
MSDWRLGIPPGRFLLEDYMESLRQMLSAMYVALAEVAGDDVLRDANSILKDAIDCGAVDDIYARSALLTLVKSSTPARRGRTE